MMMIDEARELLGDEFSYMTDTQIKKLVADVDVLATIVIRVAKEAVDKGTLVKGVLNIEVMRNA